MLHGASKLGDAGHLLQRTDPYIYVSLTVLLWPGALLA